MIRNTQVKTRGMYAGRASMLALMAAVVMGGCSEPLSPERDFLIRTPARRTTFSRPVAYEPSPASAETVLFEWSPASGADSYTITFWRGEDEAEIERLEADFASPLMTFEVTAPRVEEAPVNPENPDDPRRVSLVVHEVPLADIAAALQSAGETPGTTTYTLLSVFAKNGSDEWRSSSLTPVVFELQP